MDARINSVGRDRGGRRGQILVGRDRRARRGQTLVGRDRRARRGRFGQV
jgi:hypothetical protein